MKKDSATGPSSIYLERHLSDGDNTFTETALLQESKYIVILAEPGGGKTELMKSLARKLDTEIINASVLMFGGISDTNIPLLIDAVDEVATIEQGGIFKLMSEVKKTKPALVIMSSRSSEWGQSSTMVFEQFLGCSPLLVRLNEFDRQQQSEIFKSHTSGEDFQNFEREISRFNLEMLLPNPQFLKMFADAYIESNKHFSDKRSIFSLAVERLAKEANAKLPLKPLHLSLEKKISLASEAFAKLLLSAAEGITTTEANENRFYPLLVTLLPETQNASDIISTRLFRLGEREHQHRPVHKIVVEYCAANYLVQRITNSQDSLTLSKCLAIIAPNNVPRDELRGLIGWMAALGSKTIQEKLIEIDAYAVLANGDPSQLEPLSKKLLLSKLKEIEEKDPYFRRGDFWRRFSVAGFFTVDITDEIRTFILESNDGHLRGLILELISGSEVVESLLEDINYIVGNIEESNNIRNLAAGCLLQLEEYNFSSLLQTLLFESSYTALNISASIIENVGVSSFKIKYISNYLRLCAHLYPTERDTHERVVGSRYFIRKFSKQIPREYLVPLLDSLTANIICTCGKDRFECYCRLGISKVVGLILDRYFEDTPLPYSPQQLWAWTNKLIYDHQIDHRYSKAVETLQSDTELRQSILVHALGSLTDDNEIHQLKIHIFQNSFYAHSGLQMRQEDYRFILDYAFKMDNYVLWANFFCPHRRFISPPYRGKDELRHLMRKHANSKPGFMKVWARLNKPFKMPNLNDLEIHRKLNRRKKRKEREQKKIRLENIAYVNENRELIESGRHFNCLVRFAELTLLEPKKLEIEFENDPIIRNSLKNCIDFIAPQVPNLAELAKLHCDSKVSHFSMVLYAACLEIFRTERSLDGIPTTLLFSLRAGINTGYTAISDDERDKFKAEIDRILFENDSSNAEKFLRGYVAPQLQQPCAYPEILLLKNEPAFSHLRESLTLEWLENYTQLDIDSLEMLFDIAVKYCDRDAIKKIIAHKCDILDGKNHLIDTNIARMKKFWFIRDFYFNESIKQTRWDFLALDKFNIMLFQKLSGNMAYHENPDWPELSAIKIETFLNSFVELWPQDKSSNYKDINSDQEKAWNFLNQIIWKINSDDSPDTFSVIKRLLSNAKLEGLKNELQSIHATQIRKQALLNFVPPTPNQIVDYLDYGEIVTVEALRQLLIEELHDFQRVLNGGEFNTTDRFYQGGEHLDENSCTAIIAERLNLRLEPQGISITPEHQLRDHNRSDFTATKLINGKRRLLVTEVKGQWHRDLFTAASAQLYDRYSIHPDAEQQGIFLALWFGKGTTIAGKTTFNINSAEELKIEIERLLPNELRTLIDIFVLDVSR